MVPITLLFISLLLELWYGKELLLTCFLLPLIIFYWLILEGLTTYYTHVYIWFDLIWSYFWKPPRGARWGRIDIINTTLPTYLANIVSYHEDKTKDFSNQKGPYFSDFLRRLFSWVVWGFFPVYLLYFEISCILACVWFGLVWLQGVNRWYFLEIKWWIKKILLLLIYIYLAIMFGTGTTFKILLCKSNE